MLRIAVCCGGGFSSSSLSVHLNKQTKKNHREESAAFIFIPVCELYDRMNEVDIALVCPSMGWFVGKEADKYTIPVAIIPPRLYGLMEAEDFIEDAEDLLALWQKGAKNIVSFEDELKPLSVMRTTSHRRHLAGEKTDFNAIKKDGY